MVTNMEKTETATELSHRWQAHRIRCLELAVSSGATYNNIVDVAEKIGTYILTKSELEKTVHVTKEED